MPAFTTCIAERTTALRGALACVLVGAAMLCAPVAARAAMTPAGVMIDNTAHLAFLAGTTPTSLASNPVSLQVQEIVDVGVELLTPELDVDADAQDQRLTFRVTNLGNGHQAFDLTISAVDGDFDPQACRTLVDWDGDGVPEVLADRFTPVTPVLAPGQSVLVWVSCNIPNARAGARGRILLSAFPSFLRNGMSVLDSPGADGVYRVLGRYLRAFIRTGGQGGVTSPPATYRIGSGAAASTEAQLVKTQAVRDTAGGARAMPGAIVTYSLEARFGAAPGANVHVTDAIPAGSTYVAGSLTLDGASLTDSDDSDAGRLADGGIDVALGDVAALARRLVTFKVRINPIGNPS